MSTALAAAQPAPNQAPAPPGGDEGSLGWIGDRLARSLDALRRLALLFGALPADLEGPEIEEAEERLQALAALGPAAVAGFAARREASGVFARALKAAAPALDDLSRALRTLNMVAVNARMAAVGALSAGEGLELFTTDMAQLLGQANTLLARLAAAHRLLQEDLRRLDRQWAGLEAAHRERLLDSARRLRRPLEEAGARRRTAAANAGATVQSVHALAGRIAAPPQPVRMGEAAGQRLEHAQAMPGLFDALCRAHGERLDPSLRPCLRQAVHRLQAAQLGAARAAFEEETADLARRLGEASGEAAALAERATAGSEAALVTLGEAIADAGAEAGAVLRSYEREKGEVEAAASAMAGTIAGLCEDARAILAIPGGLRLLCLNASVRSAQLGAAGRVLTVIAEQLRDVTAEAATAAGSAAAALANAEAFFPPLQTNATIDAGRSISDAVAASALYPRAGRRLAAALAILREAAPRVAGLLGEGAAAAAAQTRLKGILEAAHARAAGLCTEEEIGASLLSADARAPLALLLSAIRRLYSQDAERLAHDRFIRDLMQPGGSAVLEFSNPTTGGDAAGFAAACDRA